jgi:transcriptional regulator with XRE-family HTH domain
MWYGYIVINLREQNLGQEKSHNVTITPIQCRMARAAVGYGVRDLADAMGVSPNTITRFERGEALKDITIEAIQRTLEIAGVEFIPENGGGAGVRLLK